MMLHKCCFFFALRLFMYYFLGFSSERSRRGKLFFLKGENVMLRVWKSFYVQICIDIYTKYKCVYKCMYEVYEPIQELYAHTCFPISYTCTTFFYILTGCGWCLMSVSVENLALPDTGDTNVFLQIF